MQQKRSVDKSNDQLREHHDYLIIGAGPAGLQMGYYFEKNNDDYVILERSNKAGSFFAEFPKHRELISINKKYIESDPGVDINEYALRHDWNSLISDDVNLRFTRYSNDYFPCADNMVAYLNDYAQHFNLNIVYDANVTHISREGNDFIVQVSQQNQMTCRYLIICTGVSVDYQPNIAGIEHAINYRDLDIHSDEFINKRICILGKGNSALETANHLANQAKYVCLLSKNPPKFAWDSHFVGHIRAVNSDFYDTYQLKSMGFSYELMNISIAKSGDNFYIKELPQYSFDKIIQCTGFAFDFSIFDAAIKPAITKEKFPKINWQFESTSTSNLFFCGTITQSLDFKENTLGFIHGFRYSAKFIYDVIMRRKKSKTFETVRFNKSDSGQLVQWISKELSQNSCIWQMFKFWCLLVVIEEDGFVVYKNLPVEYVKANEWLYAGRDIILITHEYGFDAGDDVFASFELYSDYNGYVSKFIHPVFRFHPNVSNRFELKSKVQCSCGQWEDIDFIKQHRACHQCIDTGYCPCGNSVPMDYLMKHFECESCRNHIKLAVKIHDYAKGKNVLFPFYVQLSKSSGCLEKCCYELHLMEDLLGRYFSVEPLSSYCIENRIPCFNSDNQAKFGCHRNHNLIIYRYFDYLFHSIQVDCRFQEFAKTIRVKSRVKGEFFYLRHILSNCITLIDGNRKTMKTFISERDYNLMVRDPRVKSRFESMLQHLKKKSQNFQHQLETLK